MSSKNAKQKPDEMIAYLIDKLAMENIHAHVSETNPDMLVAVKDEKECTFVFSITASQISEMDHQYILPVSHDIESIYIFIVFVMKRNITKQIEFAATNFVKALGVQTNLKGYQFLITAICMCVTRPELMDSYTGSLYPEIAEFYNKAQNPIDRLCVERNIRSALERAYANSPELMQKQFHYPIERPTCSEVISLGADTIRREYF